MKAEKHVPYFCNAEFAPKFIWCIDAPELYDIYGYNLEYGIWLIDITQLFLIVRVFVCSAI